jgi:hypothetical protein
VSKNLKEFSGVGGIIGFQAPLGVRKRKKKVDEMLALNEELRLEEVVAFLTHLDEQRTVVVEGLLDEQQYVKLAEMIHEDFIERAIRELIRRRIKEIVRKQDGGGYTLYAPNMGKKKGAKKVGEFPTRAAARRSELMRFPPRDPDKLQKRRKELDKIRKDPSLAAKVDRPKSKGKKPPKKAKKKREGTEALIGKILEGLFREEAPGGSQWDEYVSRLSKQAVLADKTFQSHQKNIVKKSEGALKDAVKIITKALGAKGFDVDDGEIKSDSTRGVVYSELSFGDEEGAARVGPVYAFVEDGRVKIEVSDSAKASLTKIDPERGKILRGELMAVQEDVLDKMQDVLKAVQKRDEYLEKLQGKLDNFVANLDSLEITMLKNLLTQKYRQIS